MAFNIYEWRRNQLITESSIHPDPQNLYTGNLDADQNKQRKQMLQQLLDWEKNSPNPDPESIKYLESQLGNLNEGKITVKSIKFSDLGDKNLLPTNIGMGSSRKIKDEEDFKAWKVDFLKKHGNIELEKGNAGWKASPEHEANKQAQADFDKNAKKK